MGRKKGCITWNKGLKGIHLSLSSEFKKGDNFGKENPFYGKKHSSEVVDRIKHMNLGKKLSKRIRRKMSLSKLREKNINWKGGLPICSCGKQLNSYGAKKCHSCFSKALWSNPFNREKIIRNTLKGLIKRPTSLEKQRIDIIKRNNLPYKYVGDGSFLIGYKNPDFVNINGEKKLIEVGNTFHHQNNYSDKRSKHFAKYGWKSYIFIMDKLNEKQILREVTNNEKL